MSTIIGLMSGVAGSVMYANATINGLAWWQYMIIALVPTLLGIIGDFLIMVAKKKGIIESEDADKLIERKHAKEDEVLEDEVVKEDEVNKGEE